MHFVGNEVTSRGVTERRFDVKCDGRVVPGLVWLPEGARESRPLVLMGHGGTLHKGSDYIRMLGRRFVRHHGFAAAAIDGPVHGDRCPVDPEDHEALGKAFRENWTKPGVTDEMVADWRASLDALQGVDGIGDGPVGYWGLSMGTIYGLPFVAAEPRVQVAVLGMMGVTGPTAKRMEADARNLRCPLFFLVQWDDELVPRETALALFDAMGCADKRLHAHPGPHTGMPGEAFNGTEDFLATRLKAGG